MKKTLATAAAVLSLAVAPLALTPAPAHASGRTECPDTCDGYAYYGPGTPLCYPNPGPWGGVRCG